MAYSSYFLIYFTHFYSIFTSFTIFFVSFGYFNHFLVFWPLFDLFNNSINIDDYTDALTTRMNPKPIGTQIWFASVRAQCHSFFSRRPENGKVWKWSWEVVRRWPRAAEGRPRSPEDDFPRPFSYFSVFRSSGKEKEKKMKEKSKPQTKAIFYLKWTPLQHIKRWGS